MDDSADIDQETKSGGIHLDSTNPMSAFTEPDLSGTDSFEVPPYDEGQALRDFGAEGNALCHDVD